MMNKYMVTCELSPFNLEIHELIPRQRMVVGRLFDQGVLITYTLAADRSKLWMILQASSESELLTYIHSMPMCKHFDYHYHEIMFHDANKFIHSISLN